MKRFLSICVFVFTTAGAYAQVNHTKCGSNIVLHRQFQNDENRIKYETFQEAVWRYTQNPRVARYKKDGVRIIPVVFHILHDGGSENISRARCEAQIEVLNQDFNRLNPDTINTPERFYGDTEYTHFEFNGADIAAFIDDSAYVRLTNRYGETFAFHYSNGTTSLASGLKQEFNTVVEMNLPASPDTVDYAEILAQHVNAQNGFTAQFIRDTTFIQAPNFLVNNVEQSSLTYTTEHTFTTVWNGSDTDTLWADTLQIHLFNNQLAPFVATDTLAVFPSNLVYNVYDGSGNVISTAGFAAEATLVRTYTPVPVAYGPIKAEVHNDGLGKSKDVLTANLLGISATVAQQGSYLPANSKIEFRLATKDPLGNCTDGIVRVFTSKTNDANDDTGFKAESYWNAYSYLNIWCVKNIDLDVQNGGRVLGYAQFPNSGVLSKDGITVLASNINVAAAGGRTATHEVGHWLSLAHIWGDASCGSDDVLDTPTHAGPNYKVCGNVGEPLHTNPYNYPGCDPSNHDGEMFNNYMDYSDGDCMNMFTLGQKARMDFVLEGDGNDAGYRSYLISEANLAATGTANPYAPSDCSPISAFHLKQYGDFVTQKMICEGEQVIFNQSAYNAEVDDYLWTFKDGSPGTATSSNPSVTYVNPGLYDVSLKVSNAFGSDTHTEESVVLVSSATAQYQSTWGYANSFWSKGGFNKDYHVFNHDDSGNKWEWYSGENGGNSGKESVRMNNYQNTLSAVDELVSPSFNLKTVDSPSLKFKYSGAAASNKPNDRLEIFLSNNCGETWQKRKTFTGYELANNGFVDGSYKPNGKSIWSTANISLGLFERDENVRVKFKWIAGGGGNNFYIDDVTLSNSPVGVDEFEKLFDFSIAPNPTNGITSATLSVPQQSNFKMDLLDVFGKNIQRLVQKSLGTGIYKFDIDLSANASGVYFLRISLDQHTVMKKIVKN
ncbi:M43 family zinc metalloprotease [Bacteroidota bacterium]